MYKRFFLKGIYRRGKLGGKIGGKLNFETYI